LFSELIRNVELGMAKAILDIARLYSGTGQKRGPADACVRFAEEEYSFAPAGWFCKCRGNGKLLENNRVLGSVQIRLRKPLMWTP